MHDLRQNPTQLPSRTERARLNVFQVYGEQADGGLQWVIPQTAQIKSTTAVLLLLLLLLLQRRLVILAIPADR